ncbi:MAG: phospholipase [Leptospirales bacterium]|nr:phospholipase [Leptospirales bacterium]
MLRASVFAILTSGFVLPLSAWSEHNMLGYYGLRNMPELRDAPPVAVESLESFLFKERAGLAKLLEAEEQWAIKNIPNYPARPRDLKFNASSQDLKTDFLTALRMHPGSKIPLYHQLLPYEELGGRPTISGRDITIFKAPIWMGQLKFAQLREGELRPAVEVVASGCEEPDYGLDIGMFENNNTEWGKKMGFGVQPFGNPNLEYGSQAPFHMGFYHEAKIVYLLAGFLKKTYPEVRVRQSYALARYAFKTGHPYWGYRFMGWGSHYVQDLTQPYHASVLPGVGTLRMLWINFLDIIGRSKSKTEIIQLVSNRHLALENFQRRIMYRDLKNKDLNHPYWFSLQDSKDDAKVGSFDRNYLRKVVTKESEGRSDDLSRQIMALMPVRLVDDPGVEFEDEKASMDLLDAMEKNRTGSVEQFSVVLAGLTGATGMHPRNYVRAILASQDEYDR